jgi:hypothetical protein
MGEERALFLHPGFVIRRQQSYKMLRLFPLDSARDDETKEGLAFSIYYYLPHLRPS